MSMLLILCNTKTSFIYDSFVHEEYEYDTYDFLKEHEKESTKKEIINNTKIEWGQFILTNKDVKLLKDTCWFFNNKTEGLEHYLKEGILIEVITHEYILN